MPEADQNNRNRSGLGNSRFEINFRRLLKVCEAHTAKFVKAIEINSEEADVFPSWRLSKYIGTLEGLLEEMKKGASVDADVLKENEKKVKYLRSVCPVYVGAFSSASACDDDDHSPKKLSPLTDSSLVMSSGHFSPRGVQQAPDTPTGRVIESTLRATLEESARRELIGDPFPETGLRNRHNAGMSNDVDAILSAHQAEQDRVAEEMLHLAQSLKEQSQAAKAIICKDKDVLDVTNVQAETNMHQLQKESNVLAGYRANACKCWIYVLMFFVCATFIGMVFFMRLFPKGV